MTRNLDMSTRERKRDRVEAIIPYDGRYMVEKLLDPKYPDSIGMYRCPGGKIEDKEEPVDALMREFKEEYGLEVKRSQLSYFSQVEGSRGMLYRFIAVGIEIKPGTKSAEGVEELALHPLCPDPWF